MPIYKNKQAFHSSWENCLYINFKWKKKPHNFPVSKPTSQVLVHLFLFNISKLCSFGDTSFKKCCHCREMQWLRKMKTGIEGFVWCLSIVPRSLLGFLFDLKIVTPRPLPGLSIHYKCAHLQRCRSTIPQPYSTQGELRFSPPYYLLELDQPPN